MSSALTSASFTNSASFNSAYNLDSIKTSIDTILLNLVDKIALDYNLDANELKTKYGLVVPAVPVAQVPEAPAPTPKPRAGRKKNKNEFTEMTKYTYNGESYLMDKQNNIYTYNLESPTLIGVKLVNGEVKLSLT
jgi:hypothetical protein